ncbi:aminotransferase class III-fold pyridoxal phosphate-dependent enzyme [Uliginosibacterium gangwonense]|uniref:aminotransferase class III-fold pyridoxal phosphate-dependent enzyme n=1 Tax=Uliginosibacterium gangwonense TaxID=392736 RepID=UPI001B7FE6F0|nr:aminotransferase class III-fold pyridoxal phosphate-dependent enzyme [Uliginosibacterium gangwonense]
MAGSSRHLPSATAMTYPKPQSRAMLDELAQYVIAEPKPFAVDIRKSRGIWLAAVDGDRLMDWCGLYGSRLLGYNHPHLYEADYLERLGFAANNKMANPDFLTEECLAYYRLLHRLAPECMRNQRVEVYAVNSGAEAVENMMKYFINLHHNKQLAQGKTPANRRFIYFEQAFHGRTVYALNITKLANDPIATRDYQGIIQGNLQVPFPEYDSRKTTAENEREVDICLANLEYLMRTYGNEIVGVILEPLQGAGGHRIALPRFYQELSRLCHRYDICWGLDEVQTSGGQLGKVFCVDLYDVPYPPQAIAVAKKFGNGVIYMLNPMKDIGVLDSTWGGNLADMVRFVQEWSVVENEKLIEAVPAKAEQLVAGLNRLVEQYPEIIGNVRGLGLYQGFTLLRQGDKVALINDALEQESLLLLGAGTDSIRFRPPLDVTREEIGLMLEKLGRLLAKMQAA